MNLFVGNNSRLLPQHKVRSNFCTFGCNEVSFKNEIIEFKIKKLFGNICKTELLSLAHFRKKTIRM